MSLISKAKEIINRMDEYYDNNQTVMILLCLKNDDIIKLIEKFNKMKKGEISDELLDCIEAIIIYAKLIYSNELYVDPYDDEFYDKMIAKYKKFREEPYGNEIVKGVAEVEYTYDTLAGTLDKYHFIYKSDIPKDDGRPSVEEFIMSLPDGLYEYSILVNQKKDGTSVVANYKLSDKKPRVYIAESGVSRGSRSYGVGTDVSPVFKGIEIPHSELKYLKSVLGYLPEHIGIQYELLVSDKQKKEFEKFCGKKYANHRSAASGLLRRLLFAKPKEQAKLRKMISLVPVGFEIAEKDKVYDDDYDFSVIYPAIAKTFIIGDVEMEYKVMKGTKIELLKKIGEYADKQIGKRSSLNHAIDGLVISLCDPIYKKLLGRKNGINKWQAAYKFPEQFKKTKIIGYEITSGNFGYKDLLLITEPVVLNGTTQFKIQTHSLDRLAKLDPRIGDEIFMQLSGDVIPYGYKDKTCKKGKGDRIKYPTTCDHCGSPLIEDNNRMRCPNRKCPSRIAGALTTFFSELNSKGIGYKTSKKLHEELGVDSPSDLLKLKEKDLRKVKGFKDGLVKSTMETIQDVVTRPRSVAAILSSLGIDSFRTSTATKLLEVITIDDLVELAKNKDKKKLVQILKKAEGIDTNAEMIASGLIENVDELVELLGLMTIKEAKKYATDRVLVVSGFRPDDDFIEYSASKGYKVKDSGKKMDLLIIKDENYMGKSKARYAEAHGIPIMLLSEFMKFLGM